MDSWIVLEGWNLSQYVLICVAKLKPVSYGVCLVGEVPGEKLHNKILVKNALLVLG